MAVEGEGLAIGVGKGGAPAQKAAELVEVAAELCHVAVTLCAALALFYSGAKGVVPPALGVGLAIGLCMAYVFKGGAAFLAAGLRNRAVLRQQ